MPNSSDTDATKSSESDARSQPSNPRSEMHSPLFHVPLYNLDPEFPCAVVINQRREQSIRWHMASRLASAVVVGQDSPWLILSVYLPQPGRGDELYDEAVEDVQTLMSKVPRSLKHKFIVLGCNENEQLAHCPEMQHVIGP